MSHPSSLSHQAWDLHKQISYYIFSPKLHVFFLPANCLFNEVTMKLIILLNIIYSLFPFNLPHFPAVKILTKVKGHRSNFIFNFHNFWGSMPLSTWGGWCPWHHIWRLICSWKYHYLTAIQLQSSEAHPVEGNKRRSWSIKKLKHRVNTRTNFNSFSLCSRLQGNPEVLIKQKGSGIFHKANHTTGWFINSWMPLAFR